MITPEHAAERVVLKVAVLDALEDERWRTSAEIIDQTDRLPLALRLMLKELADRGLVRRNITGRWPITVSGVVPAGRQRVARDLR